MRRNDVTVVAIILGYSVACGSVLGALYIKATEPGAPAASLWLVYVSLGVFPALVVLWLPRIPWIALTYVAGSLAVELVTCHLVIGCSTANDCMGTTLAATAVPFVFLYCIVSVPVSILFSRLLRRGEASD